MNPFSTRYYRKQNKAKVSKIIFIISMISLIYVGGLYLTNINEESISIERELKDFVEIGATFDDVDGEQIKALEQEFKSLENIEVIPTRYNFYQYKTMLGFSNGYIAYVFSKDEFKRFNEKGQIIPSDVEISDNTILISEKQARFINVKDNDLFLGGTDLMDIRYGEAPFKIVTYPSKAFMVYFITEDSINTERYLVTWKNGSSEAEFYQKIEELRDKYDNVNFETYEDKMDNLKVLFKINNIIYYSIIAIISIVFAITSNAMLVGIYDGRRNEFALYRSIGITKRSIYKKVTGEILSMNGIGLIIGGVISILVVALLNKYIFYKDGLSMWYFHKTALVAVIICDLAIIIPGIGLRIRSLSREARDVNFL